MTRTATGMLAAAAMLLVFDLPEANAQQRHTKIGTLTCRLAPSVGLIVGSRQRMDCRFTADRGGSRERYSGVITRIGLDLGFTTGGTLVWGVFAPGRGPQRGALRGTYVGASADAAFVLGLGANVLVGGFNRSVALQPLSVSGQTGISLAAGVAGLTLR